MEEDNQECVSVIRQIHDNNEKTTDNNDENSSTSTNDKSVSDHSTTNVKSDSKKSQISLNTNESDMSLGSETDQKSDLLNVTATRHSWHADETLKGDCGVINNSKVDNRREV